MTLIKAEELFDHVRKLWPVQVSTSIEALNYIYWPLDRKYRDKRTGDPWIMVGCWAFHQALCRAAKDASDKFQFTMLTSAADIKYFDAQMSFNLSNDSWDNDRHLYVKFSDNSSKNKD